MRLPIWFSNRQLQQSVFLYTDNRVTQHLISLQITLRCMALTCPKCGRNVPDDAVSCPYCMRGLKPSALTMNVSVAGLLMLVDAIASFIIFLLSLEALFEIYSWY